MRAPRLLAVGPAAAALLLSGCGAQKPSPIVSVVSGGQFVHSEATSWCFEGQDPAQEPDTGKGCSVEEERPELVRVRAGEQVGVDVDEALSDRAWVVVLQPQGAPGPGEQQPQEQASPVQDEHYFGFVPQFQGGRPLELQVRSLASDEPGAAVTGLWRFVLAPA